MRKIITIGREFGSGGRELGRRLAEELGIQYYDKEIITEVAKKTSLSEEYVAEIVEGRKQRLYPITIGKTLPIVADYHTNMVQSVFIAQSKIIKELAEKSDCIIVGRCADYILREMSPYRIFVYASMESRIKRCMEREVDGADYSEKDWKKMIKRHDRQRAEYYGFYTGLDWGSIENYDLCINTSEKSIKEMVPYIAKLFLS